MGGGTMRGAWRMWTGRLMRVAGHVLDDQALIQAGNRRRWLALMERSVAGVRIVPARTARPIAVPLFAAIRRRR